MIVLFLAFSIPPDWVYLNAKTVQDRHTQRGIEMDAKELAMLMSRPEAEVVQWINGLRLFTDKGATVEEAIEIISSAWSVLLDRVTQGMYNENSVYFDRVHDLRDSLAGRVWYSLYAPSLGEGDGR